MDKTLIWMLVVAALALLAMARIINRQQRQNFDIEQYMLGGRNFPALPGILASLQLSLLGAMALPHAGLLFRGGFSYGFAGLAVIIVPATSALFARRLWILGRLYRPLTIASLLGGYYRSKPVRTVMVITTILVSLCLGTMGVQLAAQVLASPFSLPPLGQIALMTLLCLLIFWLAAQGGMGAVLKFSAASAAALILALVAAALLELDSLGGLPRFLAGLTELQNSDLSAPLLHKGAFFDFAVAAAPRNMPWPGLMVVALLPALAGLALGPLLLSSHLSLQSGTGFGHQQFFASALAGGLLFLLALTIFAFAPHMMEQGTISAGLTKAGSEPKILLRSLSAHPLALSLISLALVAGLLTIAAGALATAGNMIAHDMLWPERKNSQQMAGRKTMARRSMAALLLLVWLVALSANLDPLPLFLLAGAFSLQLLPMLIGLCYFPALAGETVYKAAVAGLVVVFVTSTIAQHMAQSVGLPLPFDRWPLTLHPAVWGLLANALALLLHAAPSRSKDSDFGHRQSYHLLPDGAPVMAPDTPKWRLIALFLAASWLLTIIAPLTDLAPPGLFPASFPALWGWQIMAWLVGLALIFVLAYRLQPVFDPDKQSVDRRQRRFRIKANMREAKAELPTKTEPPAEQQKETK